MPPKIKRMFVLMMENRSYDNIFGFSDFSGWTPDGRATKADGLLGKPPVTNKDASGHLYTMGQGAPFCLNFDPGHEFSDVLAQACGPNSVSLLDCANDSARLQNYPNLKPATDLNQLGFAYDLSAHGYDVASAFRCFTPDQLPVLNFLAHQFAVCDRWFSSVPGPTWPNRFFALAGTSWGLDHSPTTRQVIEANIFDGATFGAGNDSLFTRLAPQEWLIAFGDTPQSWAIRGVRENRDRLVMHTDLWEMLQTGTLGDAKFIFIEPNYDPGLSSAFYEGDSMHPQGDVRKGEALIQKMYNAIKNSPYWDECVFLIVFDEHGGFFDHVIPDASVVPNDKILDPVAPTSLTQRGFRFDRYGFRVPAIVISPFVRPGTIDHSFYDHVSIAKTLNLIVNRQKPPLLDTLRYVQADDFGKILALNNPRSRDDIPPCPNALPIKGNSNARVASRTAAAFANLNWAG
jgi:phospholipase C